MKKEYKKPELYFDSFELSANIAFNCILITHHSDKSCPIKDPNLGITIFVENPCNYGTPDEGDDDCYHAGANSNLFTS